MEFEAIKSTTGSIFHRKAGYVLDKDLRSFGYSINAVVIKLRSGKHMLIHFLLCRGVAHKGLLSLVTPSFIVIQLWKWHQPLLITFSGIHRGVRTKHQYHGHPSYIIKLRSAQPLLSTSASTQGLRTKNQYHGHAHR